MKIWDQEVDNCDECDYCSDYGIACNKLRRKFALPKIDKIEKDCPFNKHITKEVIEGFGLKLISNKNNWYEFRNNKCDLYVNLDFQKPTHLNIHSRGSSFIGNCKPKVNNPIELEFILKSLGVV